MSLDFLGTCVCFTGPKAGLEIEKEEWGGLQSAGAWLLQLLALCFVLIQRGGLESGPKQSGGLWDDWVFSWAF